MNPVQALKWTMTLLIPCGVYFLSPQDVSPHFPLYMGLTSAAIIAWALNVFPAIGVAAMLTFAYILCGVADAEVVFGPWATVLPWLSFAAVIIGEGMEKTGLAKRLALRCLKLTGGSFNGLVAGFFLAGLVLVVILPSILARVVIFCAIAVGIIQALQLDAKSRMSSTIVMMAFFAAAAPQFMFLHSSESFIWAFGMMLKGTDKTVNFWDYAYQATFINLIYYALSMATVYIVKGRETLVSGAHFSTFIEQSCREMGPIQPREIKLLVLVFGIILGFMLEPLTHIDPVYVCCVLALLSYLPGINVLDRESFSNLNIVPRVHHGLYGYRLCGRQRRREQVGRGEHRASASGMGRNHVRRMRLCRRGRHQLPAHPACGDGRVYARLRRAGDSHERKPAPAVLRIQLWPGPVHLPV